MNAIIDARKKASRWTIWMGFNSILLFFLILIGCNHFKKRSDERKAMKSELSYKMAQLRNENFYPDCVFCGPKHCWEKMKDLEWSETNSGPDNERNREIRHILEQHHEEMKERWRREIAELQTKLAQH